MTYDFEGKTALVTGANRGIGKAIVETFLANGVGKVYAAVRDLKSVQPLVDRHGDRVVAVEFDLGRDDLIQAAARTASDVDIVVNNAGVLRTAGILGDEAFDALAYEIDMNVLGLARTARAFAPVLASNGGGAFVQLNSVASFKSFPAFATYAASKAAAYSLTQALRSELAAQGTQVISVHPGPIATDMGAAAGMSDIAEPPALVGESILEALKTGAFHAFPDSLAKQVGGAYESFAKNVIEASDDAGH